MKLKIRWCIKCQRETLQVKGKWKVGGSLYSGNFYTVGWFCSLCGMRWERIKEESDKEIKVIE